MLAAPVGIVECENGRLRTISGFHVFDFLSGTFNPAKIGANDFRPVSTERDSIVIVKRRGGIAP